MKGEDFKKKLNPEQYRVMREGGIETAFTGKYWNNEKKGTYSCAACGTSLFTSKDKFDARTGWPSFKKPLNLDLLEFKKELDEKGELEFRCKKCHSHIGRLVGGASGHYRVNSIALDFKEDNLGTVLGDVKDKVETVKDKIEEQKEKEKKPEETSALNGVSAWLTTYSQFFAGTALGAVLGIAGAFLYCNATSIPSPSTNAPIATSTPATSTPFVPEETESTSTYSTPRAEPIPESTGTPVDTSNNTTEDGTGSLSPADSPTQP